MAEALVLPVGFIITILLTRRLGPDGYGLFTLTAMLIVWVEIGLTTIFDRASITLISQTENWQPVGIAVIRLHLMMGSVFMLLFFLLAPPIASLLSEPMLVPYLRLFALDILIFSLVRAHRYILSGIGQFRSRAYVSAGYWITRLLLTVVLVELGFAVFGAIIGFIGASIVALIICRYYIRLPFFRSADFPIRRLWGYSAPLALFALTQRSHNPFALFMLKILGGTVTQAGFYGSAINLSRPIVLAIGAFSEPLLSILRSIISSGGIDEQVKTTARHSMRLVLLLLPCSGMIGGGASEIVVVIFGDAYLPAVPLVRWLIFSVVPLGMIAITTVIMTAAGKLRWPFALTGPLLPLSIVGHFLLIPQLGAIGAAQVTTFVASLGAIVTILAVHRLWRILPPLGTLIRSVLICGIAYTSMVLWPVSGMMIFVKLPAVCIGIGFAFLAMGEFSVHELATLRSLLNRRGNAAPPVDHCHK